MYKFLILAAAVACANAGYLGAPLATTYAAPAYAAYGHAAVAPAAITSQSSNILRSYGNLGQVSTYSKTIDTPYSSVTKSDVRVSNPGVRTLAPAAYAPAYAARAYAPAVATYAAAPAVASYAAAPAVAAYHAPALAAPAYAARAYAAPALAAPAVAAHGLLGVAYSAAPAVAHVSYDSPIVHYAI
ncbi:cuticle protein 76 [Halyomorpha halys]|uniref:cuticle protein 76 n=1 Tax=Halyomorpha halys TaxID=286706 RepID=UPI0006D4FCE7|nr:cuticle protein 76-like [Halyomorpha halys]KAE8572939.1 Cuticle Protein CPF [Halyomorpha halys]